MKQLSLYGAALLLSTVVATTATRPEAQSFAQSQPAVQAVAGDYAPVPFGLGESIKYQVRVGIFGKVGSGSLTVEDIDTIHGHETYQLRMHIEGGVPLLKVRDDYHSWFDVKKLISRRFKTDVDEPNYERKRTFDFFPDEKKWIRIDKPTENGTLPTDKPLDDLSFLYYVRTLPLRVGETYTFNHYFKEEGNPVTLKVLRKETVTVPAGTYNTIVVQPLIRTKGLFGEGGKAEVYFTDDDKRIPVQIKTTVKYLKYMNMYLQSYTPGKRISPAFRVPTDGQ